MNIELILDFSIAIFVTTNKNITAVIEGWIQGISATRLPVKTSRGVKPPNTFRGVRFSNKIRPSICSSVSVVMSNFLGQNRLIQPQYIFLSLLIGESM